MNTKQIEINDIDSDAAEFSLQELVNVVILLVIIGIVAVALAGFLIVIFSLPINNIK